MTTQRNPAIHLIAGGAGGTAGAILTCPLEVVKTRLQSSVYTFPSSNVLLAGLQNGHGTPAGIVQLSTCAQTSTEAFVTTARPSIGIVQCIRHIVENEGVLALFKGLGPNLVGVAPSRAIYFGTYAQAKKFFNRHLKYESSAVHMCSAMTAGFTACTLTNPIWYVKTRLQLDQKKTGDNLTVRDCVRKTYGREGLRGFYRGVTASYAGISETVIHFVIYEHIKQMIARNRCCDCEKTWHDFVEFMGVAAVSKSLATCIAYPHEVVRTRLRQEGKKYRGFFQTVTTVAREEGYRALYSGLKTQLVRQIPNTATMMAVYEVVVYLLEG
ncbi:solute carrier family 25 member 36-like isoform X2 [Branchiostoma lanceolatum]|uniref:solute carrier family 25 member 36-like isoform X2 n=1 Tax=Branchiostoma lanceolatum TaxID=7740 RepID=UPI0034515016